MLTRDELAQLHPRYAATLAQHRPWGDCPWPMCSGQVWVLNPDGGPAGGQRPLPPDIHRWPTPWRLYEWQCDTCARTWAAWRPTAKQNAELAAKRGANVDEVLGRTPTPA